MPVPSLRRGAYTRGRCKHPQGDGSVHWGVFAAGPPTSGCAPQVSKIYPLQPEPSRACRLGLSGRTEFLGLVSHELREPLAVIKGSATTLMEDAVALDPAEMREFHRIIVEQANHMRGLIGDLLDAGRIDSGTLSLAPEPSEVAELVERARNTFLGGGGRHGIAIDLPVGPAAADGRQSCCRGSLTSTPGQGRSPATGGGLRSARGWVEAHGGRIRAESAGPSLGTTVTFTLPGGGGTVDPTDPTSDDGRGFRKAIVLLMDGEDTICGDGNVA